MELKEDIKRAKICKFPLNDEDWNEFIETAQQINPTATGKIQEINNNNEFTKEYAALKEPLLIDAMNVSEKIFAIQKFLNHLQYDHTGTQFFEIKKKRSIARLNETAKEIIKTSLPIKCLEAVIVALYLTARIHKVTRFTIRFKSQFGKTTHRHIVLGLYHSATYGALGLSRRKTLMFKPLIYKSLSDLILDYKKSYEECFHVLKKVKLSLPISKHIHSCDQINWNFYSFTFGQLGEDEIRSCLEKYSRELRSNNVEI